MLFVTGHVPAYRVGAFARLHEREGLELALFGGSRRHGGPDPAAACRSRLASAARASSTRSPAAAATARVVCPTGGRAALLATWAGARAGRVPVILWASLWAHPRTPAHALSYLPLRRLYRSADAVVTYGPHVSAYVRERGARERVRGAAVGGQRVLGGSPDRPSRSLPGGRGGEPTRFLFVGRPAREKGLAVLLDAWARTGLEPPAAALVLVGPSSTGSAAAGAPARARTPA